MCDVNKASITYLKMYIINILKLHQDYNSNTCGTNKNPIHYFRWMLQKKIKLHKQILGMYVLMKFSN